MLLAQEIWRETEDIPAAGLARDYLTQRRRFARWDPDRLRWHPACPWGRERVGCIVCPVASIVTPNVDGATGYTVAIWRIWPSMTEPMKDRRMGLGPCKGNFVPLCLARWRRAGVAEGVEDALAYPQLKACRPGRHCRPATWASWSCRTGCAG